MKVLIDGRMLTSYHGIGRYTWDLTQGLIAKGIKVDILSPETGFIEELGQKSEVRKIPFPTKFANPMECLSLSRVKHLDKINKYDILHFPSFALPLHAPWEKTVITIHDLIHLEADPTLTHKIYYKTVVKHALRKAKAVMASCHWTKKKLVEILKVNPHKISVVKLGVTDFWRQTPNMINPHQRFISVSNLKSYKNVKTLLLACDLLWSKNHIFELVLSLSGKDLPPELLNPQWKNKIKILKSVSDLELKNEMYKSKALVSSSFIEGFNYPAAEALSLGRAVILSKGSAHDDFSGENIFFYSPADNHIELASAMEKLLEQNLQTKNSTIRTIEEMTDDVLKVYNL